MNTVLKATRISKHYMLNRTTTIPVLHEVKLSIAQGGFISVMGPSGSGKPTPLYAISGMDRPTSGSILFGGKNLATMSEQDCAQLRLQHMGFVFQQNCLFKNLNIIDNIILSACMSRTESRQTIITQAKKLMKDMGISTLEHNDISQASGGQLQRAAICRALIHQPDILFGNEPTGALNASATRDVMNIFARMNRQGTTILLVTHDANVAAHSERVLFMADGVIAGEKYLDKLQHETTPKAREQQISNWLIQMGF